MLYINEKLAIASYKEDNILKTRTEIISKWRRKKFSKCNKCKLANYDING